MPVDFGLARQRGFTLLEVLIAFAVAALALAVLFGGALDGLRATRLAAHHEEALARARSRLAAVGRMAPIQPGDLQGDDGGGFHWRARIVPAESAPLRGAGPGGRAAGGTATLYAVTVWESWRMDGAPHEVRLDTLRLGFAPQAAP